MFGSEEMLKGVEPDYGFRNFNDRFKSFCSRHHWDKHAQYSVFLDENGDGYVKPTLKLFLYNVYKEIMGWTPFYRFRMSCQRAFRKNGLSDDMIWDAKYPLSIIHLYI